MAKNVKINNVTYSAVPSVQIPLADGGGNATFWDTSDSDAQSSYILSGHSGYGPSGKVTGTASMPSISQDGSSKILTIA